MDMTWEIELRDEFPFMRPDKIEEEHNHYKLWGCECWVGWYQLLRDCCEAIAARYAEDGIGIDDIDFEPTQVKEKFGTLRFNYGYTEDNTDDAKTKLRQDIQSIVHSAEEKSKHTCEVCGAEGELRNDSDIGIYWIRTLCDACHEERIKVRLEQERNKRETKAGSLPEDIL